MIEPNVRPVEIVDDEHAAILKRLIMAARHPDVAIIDDETAERLIAELGLKHA